jgi:hypothetical protein
MTFTITRSKWLRGETWINSYLLRESDGKQCCMGQVCQQLGVPESDLKGARGVSTERINQHQELIRDFLSPENPAFHSAWVGECYCVNDEPGLSEADREGRLASAFREHGHELIFID